MEDIFKRPKYVKQLKQLEELIADDIKNMSKVYRRYEEEY